MTKVRDPDTLADYRSQALTTVKRHEGRYLVPGGPDEAAGGSRSIGTPVLPRFP